MYHKFHLENLWQSTRQIGRQDEAAQSLFKSTSASSSSLCSLLLLLLLSLL